MKGERRQAFRAATDKVCGKRLVTPRFDKPMLDMPASRWRSTPPPRGCTENGAGRGPPRKGAAPAARPPRRARMNLDMLAMAAHLAFMAVIAIFVVGVIVAALGVIR